MNMIRAWTAFILLATPVSLPAAEVVILTTAHPSYEKASASIEKELGRKGHTHQVITLPKSSPSGSNRDGDDAAENHARDPKLVRALEQLRDADPAAIVALGEDATLTAHKHSTEIPIISSMVTNWLDLPSSRGGKIESQRWAGVTMDVQPEAQLAWIRMVDPGTRSLAVFSSDHSQRTAEALRSKARSHQIEVTIIKARKSDFSKALEKLKESNCDGLVMLPDAEIYDANNVKQSLLWGLRARKSVWTFSPLLVKSGALGATYAEPEEIGKQTASVTLSILKGKKPSSIGIQYPEKIEHALNERTAEMINLKLSPKALREAEERFGKP